MSSSAEAAANESANGLRLFRRIHAHAQDALAVTCLIRSTAEHGTSGLERR
jgi:hypothetical protein